MTVVRRLIAVGAVFALTPVVGACEYEDLNSLTLPGVKGTGDDSYSVRIEFENAMDIVANSPVRVDDLNVGSVASVELDDYQPVVTVRLEGDVDLPANAVARIGQTSLLGAKHVELGPPTDEEPRGRLGDGDTIALEQSAAYPATEEVLASVSALLNGGGLQHVRTITTEVNKVLAGREGTVRELLGHTRVFVEGLDLQKADITNALDELDRVAFSLRQGNETIARALETLPPALRVLRDQRAQLVATLQSLSRFGDLTARFLAKGGGDQLVGNIEALVPSLRGLADAGSSLTESLWVLGTVVFPLQTLDEYVRGDYYNLTVTLDLRSAALSQGLLEGTPLDSLIGTPNGLLGQPPGPGPVPEHESEVPDPSDDPAQNDLGADDGEGEGREPGGTPDDEAQAPPTLLDLLFGGSQ